MITILLFTGLTVTLLNVLVLSEENTCVLELPSYRNFWGIYYDSDC